MKKALFSFVMVSVLALSACAPTTPTSIPSSKAPSTAPPASTQIPTAIAGTGQSAVVAFVKDGDIQVWDEATGQSQTIFDSGDVIAVTISDDCELAAFLRRSYFQAGDFDRHEQSALWVVELDGENPRELVSAQELRQLLNAAETDSTNIPQMEWIPGTHRLLYTAWTYFVVAEGESHAFPEGLYLVDADTGENKMLLGEGNSLEFVPSPDGQRLALISTTALGFINTDGSSYQPNVLPYVQVGMVTQDFPKGVWKLDSSGFLIKGVFDFDPNTRSSAIWRVPVDGSPAELLATFTDSANDSVTFSPNGRHAAYYRGGGPGGWFITSLTSDVGWLDVPKSHYFFWQNIHWSPDGFAHSVSETRLYNLCPDAVQHTEVCGEGVEMDGWLGGLTWLDSNRFIYTTREPYDLYFGKLDGTSVLIAEGAEQYAAMAMTCQNQAEFAANGQGPDVTSVKASTLFQMRWRIRNSGTCTWDSSYRLINISGRSLDGPDNLPVGEHIPPGGESELSVNLTAPAELGSFHDEWQLLAPDGQPFGVRLPVDISVPSFTSRDFPPELVVAQIAPANFAEYGEGALWAVYEGELVRIDLNTNQVVARIHLVDGLLGVDIGVGFGSVWVLHLDSRTVWRIDPTTNAVSATITWEGEFFPSTLAVGAGAVWVNSDSMNGVITRIDPATNEIVAKIDAGEWPNQMIAAEEAVWITSPSNPVLRRIDPATNKVTSINLDCNTRSIAADETDIWVVCDYYPMVLRLDPLTDRIVAKIAIEQSSRGIALSGNSVWVSSPLDNTLIAIDPILNQVSAVYRVGPGPSIIAGSPDEFWLLLSGSGTIWRIEP